MITYKNTTKHNRRNLSAKLSIACLVVLISMTLEAKELLIVKTGSNEPNQSIRIAEIQGIAYISVSDFANALNSPLDTKTQEAGFNFTYHSVNLYAHSPFLQIDNNFYQLPVNVRVRFDGYFIPHPFFCMLMASLDSRISFSDSGELIINMHTPTVQRIELTTDRDLVILSLHTSIDMTENDIRFTHHDRSLECLIDGGSFSPDIDLQSMGDLFETINISHPEPDIARLYLSLTKDITFDSLKIVDGYTIELTFHNHYIEPENSVFTELRKEREKWRIDTIIIDPGHGGRDPGAVGPGGLYEKHITLDIAKSIRDILKDENNIEVKLTRESNSFIPLKSRTEIANQTGGKLFISIHVDANPVQSLHGHTVYFMGPAKTEAARQAAQFENSVIKFESKQAHYDNLSDAAFILAANAQNSYNKESQDLADIMDHKITALCGSRSIGVRQAGFYVLYGASMPNILIETGFMTNPHDRNNLRSSAYRKTLAKAISIGILEFKNKYENMTL